jgi:homopolymeric O-antigen transport system ATP-binding protein
MSDIILKAQNISKQYRLGLIGTGTLSHDLNRFWYRVRGKEDPYLTVGAVNDRSAKATEDYVWALQDINFEVKRGEVLGIIGKNGAGKSTLLKILSRVTSPTTGEIKTKGRIASLLEVGTGFHPEMTGRENIYLNGAILGMTKAEIKAKETEIIDFSGCERYINTPVKRYSSGMRVRLAFAVAAHLEPDILVIDEVLAVGDAEFQKKAVGKMQDISKGEGRTVLFVSHNMAAIQNLCTRLIVLEHGKVLYQGQVLDGIEYYLNKNAIIKASTFENEYIEINNIHLLNKQNSKINALVLGESSSIAFDVKQKRKIDKLVVRISVKNSHDDIILILNNYHTGEVFELEDVEFRIRCEFSAMQLLPGVYTLSVLLFDLQKKQNVIDVDDFYSITIESGDFYGTGILPRVKQKGVFLTEHKWTISNDLS